MDWFVIWLFFLGPEGNIHVAVFRSFLLLLFPSSIDFGGKGNNIEQVEG